MSIFFKYAAMPSCVAAIHPRFNGSWWSVLRPGAAVQNPALRNFSDESALWYDCVAALSGLDQSHDIRFRIAYHMNDLSNFNAQLFYTPSQKCLFNLYYYGNFRAGIQIPFCLDSNGNYLHFWLPSKIADEDVMVEISGNTATCTTKSDSQSIVFSTRKKIEVFDVPYSIYFDGTVSLIEFTDITTGKMIWNYPNDAERFRLITKNNVRFDRSVFEAADKARSWQIKTSLENTPATVIARLNGVNTVNPSGWKGNTFTGQAADTVEWLLAFDRVLTQGELKNISGA